MSSSSRAWRSEGTRAGRGRHGQPMYLVVGRAPPSLLTLVCGLLLQSRQLCDPALGGARDKPASQLLAIDGLRPSVPIHSHVVSSSSAVANAGCWWGVWGASNCRLCRWQDLPTTHTMTSHVEHAALQTTPPQLTPPSYAAIVDRLGANCALHASCQRPQPPQS